MNLPIDRTGHDVLVRHSPVVQLGVGEVLLVVPGRGDAQGLGLLHG